MISVEIQTLVRITQRLRSRVSPGAAPGGWWDALAGSALSRCSLALVLPLPSCPLPPAGLARWCVGAAQCWGGDTPTLASSDALLSIRCFQRAAGSTSTPVLLGATAARPRTQLLVSFSVRFPHTTLCSAQGCPICTAVSTWGLNP